MGRIRRIQVVRQGELLLEMEPGPALTTQTRATLCGCKAPASGKLLVLANTLLRTCWQMRRCVPPVTRRAANPMRGVRCGSHYVLH